MVTLVARITGPAGAKPLMLMSHADVVPAVGANWTHPPFSADHERRLRMGARRDR